MPAQNRNQDSSRKDIGRDQASQDKNRQAQQEQSQRNQPGQPSQQGGGLASNQPGQSRDKSKREQS
jgi:hypothetical protein